MGASAIIPLNLEINSVICFVSIKIISFKNKKKKTFTGR